MKKGITISILVVTVILMFTIATTATVVGTRTIQTALYEEFLSKIERVYNDVNKYVVDNKVLPTTSEIIAKEGLPSGLKEELNNKKDASNNLYVVDMTKLKTESVNIGNGSVEDMDVFIVAENTNNVYYLKGVEYRGKTYYGLDAVWTNTSVMPLEWEKNVVAIVDTVPIPKGFVSSGATGENTKDGGLVIYEGVTPVTDANVEEAKRARNQYVWVPVEDFSKFVRQNFGGTDTISNRLGSDFWEVALETTTNMPLPTQSSTYITTTTLAEVQAMYQSVKEYKGFYIARYEAGIDTQRTSNTTLIKGSNVYSMIGKIPYTYIPWTMNNSMAEDTNGAVEVARGIYPTTNTNYGVVSTLTYGVQWDRTLAWWVEVKAQNATKTVTITSNDNLKDSTKYGNYKNHVISAGDLNDDSKYAVHSSSLGAYQVATASSTKASGTLWALTTGALKAASVNNICDMAGNIYEWTMEGNITNRRTIRGGFYYYAGTADPAPRRYYYGPDNASYYYGFRTALYIKK